MAKTKADIKRELNIARSLLEKNGYNIEEKDYLTCTACNVSKSVKEGNYHMSSSRMNNGRKYTVITKKDGKEHLKEHFYMPVCKKCMEEYFNDYMVSKKGDVKKSFYLLCQEVNSVFAISAVEMAISSERNTFLVYYQKINSMNQFKGMSFKDSDSYNSTPEGIKEDKQIEGDKLKLNNREKQARNDIVQAIGRDPFENLSLRDQKALYPEFVEYLDEDTQENPFLVGQIIQVISNNNTIAKLNEDLSELTEDISQLNKNDSKTLMKDIIGNIATLSKATTTVAKENGIAKKGRESQKRSTLTGMMNYYRSLNLPEIEVDFYSQQMCYGMQQVSNISMKAIFDQGLFADLEYEEILRISRGLVKDLEKRTLILEEENRLLLIELKEMKDKLKK